MVGRTAWLAHDIETEDLGMAMRELPGSGLGTIFGRTTYSPNACLGIEIHGAEGEAYADLSGDTKWRALRIANINFNASVHIATSLRTSPRRSDREPCLRAMPFRKGCPWSCCPRFAHRPGPVDSWSH